MTRIAAVDCGTNSIRLLISDVTRTGNTPSGVSINEVTRRMEIVRLGQRRCYRRASSGSYCADAGSVTELREHHEIRKRGKSSYGCYCGGA